MDDYTLLIEFSNQELKKYSFHHLLSIPMFSPLRNPSFFKNFQVEPGGYALVWNEEIDISEHELWKNGIPVEGRYSAFDYISEKTDNSFGTRSEKTGANVS